MDGKESLGLCTHCGFTLGEYRLRGLLGCPHCYASFGEALAGDLLWIHEALAPGSVRADPARHEARFGFPDRSRRSPRSGWPAGASSSPTPCAARTMPPPPRCRSGSGTGRGRPRTRPPADSRRAGRTSRGGTSMMPWAERAARPPPWANPAKPAAAPDVSGVLLTRLIAYRNFADEPFTVSAAPQACDRIAGKAADVAARLRPRGHPPGRPGGGRAAHAARAPPAAGAFGPLARQAGHQASGPGRGRDPSSPGSTRWSISRGCRACRGCFPPTASPPPSVRPARMPAAPWAKSRRFGFLASDPSPGGARRILPHARRTFPACPWAAAWARRSCAFRPRPRFAPRHPRGSGSCRRPRSRVGAGALLDSLPGRAGRNARERLPPFPLRCRARPPLGGRPAREMPGKTSQTARGKGAGIDGGPPAGPRIALARTAPGLVLGPFRRIGGNPRCPNSARPGRTERPAQSGHLEVSSGSAWVKEEEDTARANVVRLALERHGLHQGTRRAVVKRGYWFQSASEVSKNARKLGFPLRNKYFDQGNVSVGCDVPGTLKGPVSGP